MSYLKSVYGRLTWKCTHRTAVDQKQYPGDDNTSWLQCGWSCWRVKGREIPLVWNKALGRDYYSRALIYDKSKRFLYIVLHYIIYGVRALSRNTYIPIFNNIMACSRIAYIRVARKHKCSLTHKSCYIVRFDKIHRHTWAWRCHNGVYTAAVCLVIVPF